MASNRIFLMHFRLVSTNKRFSSSLTHLLCSTPSSRALCTRLQFQMQNIELLCAENILIQTSISHRQVASLLHSVFQRKSFFRPPKRIMNHLIHTFDHLVSYCVSQTTISACKWGYYAYYHFEVLASYRLSPLLLTKINKIY